jgi:hypothetical protein
MTNEQEKYFDKYFSPNKNDGFATIKGTGLEDEIKAWISKQLDQEER